MQLTFGPDEHEAFTEVKDRLVEEFGPWVHANYGDDDGSLVADAETFLSWRFDHSNGDLSHFTPDDVEDFLLDWAPRQFAAPPEEAPTLCRSVQAMVEFLAATGRLRGGAASAARVMVYVDDLVDEVAEALADESKFGIGKSLGAVALTDAGGNPLANIEELLADPNLGSEQLQAALEQRMEAFNALPFEERRAHTDAALAEPPPELPPEPVQLPFAYIPPTREEIERSARESRLVQLVDGFVEIVATEGVKLTDAGHISLGAARRIVDALDTGDVLDVEFTGRPRRTTSSADLRWLTLIDDVATYSGAVRRLRTKLVANDEWAAQDLADRARAVVRGLLEAGPLRSRVSRWSDMHYAHRILLDDGIPHWFSTLLVDGAFVDYDDIEELALEVSAMRIPGSQSLMGASTQMGLSELFEVLEVGGIIRWHDRVVEPQRFAVSPRIVSGEVALTPLGRFALAEPVRDAGYAFADLDDLAAADGATVIDAIATGSLTEKRAMELWRPDSSIAERARLLADAAQAAEFPVQRLIAFDLLGDLEPPSAVAPAVRELLDTHCSGHAATFLLEHDLATEDEVGAFVDVGPMVDLLHSMIDDPTDLDTAFDGVRGTDVLTVIEDMWRHDQPETVEVLEALGRHLTDKRLAKAARKAVIRHRSWMADEGR